MGTHIIEAARHAPGVDKTVLVGTVCSYPKFTPVPFREESLWEGYPEETNAPYGLAKKALLVQAQANRGEFGQNVVYILPTNLYGPGDKFNPAVSHVIPALMKKCIDAVEAGANSVEVWGSGHQTREFLYVEDCADGVVLAAEHYDDGAPVNLGTGYEISISDLARKIADVSGFGGELVLNPAKPDGQPRRCVDITRARETFGFTARVGLDEGLRRTFEWYVANREAAEAATR
jgi:GDP-L-fucose synthase